MKIAILIPTGFPEELLTAYDKRRASQGVGAALLQARRCQACRLELDRTAIAGVGEEGISCMMWNCTNFLWISDVW